MTTFERWWPRAVTGAVCIACGYAALIGCIVTLHALEQRHQRKTRRL